MSDDRANWRLMRADRTRGCGSALGHLCCDGCSRSAARVRGRPRHPARHRERRRGDVSALERLPSAARSITADGSAAFNNATQPLLAFSLRELALEEDDWRPVRPVLGSGTSSSMGSRFCRLQHPVAGSYPRPGSQLHLFPLHRQPHRRADRWCRHGERAIDSVNIDGTVWLNVTDFGSLRAREAGCSRLIFLMALPAWRWDAPATPSRPWSTDNRIPRLPVADHSLRPGHDADLRSDHSVQQQRRQDEYDFVYGFTVGGGIDVALTHKISARPIRIYRVRALREHYRRDQQRACRRRPKFYGLLSRATTGQRAHAA